MSKLDASGARALACLGLASVVGACAPKASPEAVLMRPPDSRARCYEARTHQAPLVTEWSATEKANFESLLAAGGVAVEYSGCELRVIQRCRVGGLYRWRRTTPAVETLEINSLDDLYLKLPLGALALEGELARSGSLLVNTNVAGQIQLAGHEEQTVTQSADCARATHVVEAVALGAYSLETRGQLLGKSTIEVKGRGGGVHVQRDARLLRSSGVPARCAEATDEAPDRDCASPLQVFLWPIPGRAAEVGPPGTVAVDFVTADPETQWRVSVGKQEVCETPCTTWIDPSRPVVLTSTGGAGPEGPKKADDDDDDHEPDRVQLDRVESRLGSADEGLQVRAHSASEERRHKGKTLSASGGGLAFVGGFLAVFGGSAERVGLAVGGAITAGIGLALLAGGLSMIRGARPRAEVLPRRAARRARAAVTLTPTGVAGRF